MKIRSLLSIFIGLLLLGFGVNAKAQPWYRFRLQEIPQLLSHPRSFLLAHPDIMADQLSGIIARRCKHYVDTGNEQCKNAANQLTKDLHIEPIELEDPTTHQKSPYIVTFTSELKELHQDPRTLPFLKDVQDQLDAVEKDIQIYKFIAPQNIKSMELGRLALKYYGSFPFTLKALAALFQDLPQSEIQIQYLYKQYGADETVMTLHKIIRRIPGLTLKDGRLPITLFGKTAYNEKIYHTLVPAYLATQLFSRNYPVKVAFFTAFAFNYVYEASEAAGDFKTYFVEPKSLAETDTQNDIRAGEFGALLGISQSQKFISETEARSLLTKSPKDYLKRIVQALSVQ